MPPRSPTGKLRCSAPVASDQLATFDELAWITRDLDVHFTALRERDASDQRLSVPGRVFNALLRRETGSNDRSTRA